MIEILSKLNNLPRSLYQGLILVIITSRSKSNIVLNNSLNTFRKMAIRIAQLKNKLIFKNIILYIVKINEIK